MANAVASSSPDTVGGPKDGDNAKDKKDKKGKDAKRNNKIDFTIRTSKSGVSVAVDYDEEVSDGTTSATSYEISYDRIIEYTKKGNRRFGFGGNDNNNENSNANDMAYDFDNDEIVQTIQLNEWSDLSEVSLDSTGSSSYFSASTKDGTAKFNFFMNKASEGEDITSNKVKIDVWVIDFPYRKNNGESYVALLSNVNSQRAVGYKRPIDTIDPATSNAATNDRQAPPKGGSKKSKSKVNIVFRDDSTVNEAASSANEIPELPVGEYTWATTAESFTDSSAATNVAVSSIQSDEAGGTADPSMVSVIATSPSNGKDDNLEIAFSFIGLNSPKTMYWDPETGVGYASTSDATISDADSNMNDDFFQTGSDTNNGGSSSSYVPNRYGTVLSLVATFFGSCLLLSL